MPKENLDPLIEGYLSYALEVSRRAKRSVIDMRCTLRKVTESMQVLKPDVPLWKLSLDDFLEWIEIERGKGRSCKTLKKNLCHIKGLIKYAWRNGRTDRNVLDGFGLKDSLVRVPPSVLTQEEARRLIAACPARTRDQRRERIVILMLYGCGLRTSELYNLNIQEINIDRQEIFISKAKGDLQRYIPVPEGVWVELLAHLNDRHRKKGPVFVTKAKGRRLTSHGVCDIVSRAVVRAGIESHVTPKTLRHTFATHLMDQGVGLPVISVLMGHRSPHETGVYLHALPGRGAEAVKNLENLTIGEKI